MMERFRNLAWWIWPIVPALAVALFLATSDNTERFCPPYTTALPPHPEQCLPTLFPALTGADPIPVALSWVVVGALAYLAVLAVTLFVRTRGFR